MTSLLIAALLTPQAQAARHVDIEGERLRLSEELKTLSRRQVWPGADTVYDKLLELQADGAELTFRDHYLGAQAARALGDINATHERLLAADAVEHNAEVASWLEYIDENYAQVELTIKHSYKGARSFETAEIPMQPDQRMALDATREALAVSGHYLGLVPVGQYAVGMNTFDVVSNGSPQTLVLSRNQGFSVSEAERLAMLSVDEIVPYVFDYDFKDAVLQDVLADRESSFRSSGPGVSFSPRF